MTASGALKMEDVKEKASFGSGSFIHRMNGKLSAACSSHSDCEGSTKVKNKCKSRCKGSWSESDACDDCESGEVCCTKTKDTPKCCEKTKSSGKKKTKCKGRCNNRKWFDVSDDGDDDDDDDEFFEEDDEELCDVKLSYEQKLHESWLL